MLFKIAINNLNINNLSINYGNFDRNYWHYKVIDFPSGMTQSYFYALAIVYQNEIQGFKSFYKNKKIMKWILASLENTIKISNNNGSLDDYFPKEQAIGATVFVAINFVKTIKLLNLDKNKYKNYLLKVGEFIAKSNESGILSNHKAAELLTLILISKLYNTDIYNAFIEKKQSELNKNFNNEGWFEEYEGCDLGYLTVTISRLTDIYQLKPNNDLKTKINKCIEFSLNMLQPNFIIGGNFTSRSTMINFTDGFAKFAKFNKNSILFVDSINNQFQNQNNPFYFDDQIACHHLISFLETIIHVKKEKLKPSNNFHLKIKPYIMSEQYYKASGFIKKRINNYQIFIALNKGGLFKIFKNNKLISADSGICLKIGSNHLLSNNQSNNNKILIKDHEIKVTQNMYSYKEQVMNTKRLVILRFLMHTFGKYFPNIIRKLLQSILIFRSENQNVKLERSFFFNKSKIVVTDKILGTNKGDLSYIDNFNTSHIVMSNIFNEDYLLNNYYITDSSKLYIKRVIF